MVNLTGQIKTRSGSIAAFCPQQCNTFIVPCTDVFVVASRQDHFMHKKTYWLCFALQRFWSVLFDTTTICFTASVHVHVVDLTLHNPSQSCVAGQARWLVCVCGCKNWPTKCNFHISIFVSENPLVWTLFGQFSILGMEMIVGQIEH